MENTRTEMVSIFYSMKWRQFITQGDDEKAVDTTDVEKRGRATHLGSDCVTSVKEGCAPIYLRNKFKMEYQAEVLYYYCKKDK